MNNKWVNEFYLVRVEGKYWNEIKVMGRQGHRNDISVFMERHCHKMTNIFTEGHCCINDIILYMERYWHKNGIHIFMEGHWYKNNMSIY